MQGHGSAGSCAEHWGTFGDIRGTSLDILLAGTLMQIFKAHALNIDDWGDVGEHWGTSLDIRGTSSDILLTRIFNLSNANIEEEHWGWGTSVDIEEDYWTFSRPAIWHKHLRLMYRIFGNILLTSTLKLWCKHFKAHAPNIEEHSGTFGEHHWTLTGHSLWRKHLRLMRWTLFSEHWGTFGNIWGHWGRSLDMFGFENLSKPNIKEQCAEHWVLNCGFVFVRRNCTKCENCKCWISCYQFWVWLNGTEQQCFQIRPIWPEMDLHCPHTLHTALGSNTGQHTETHWITLHCTGMIHHVRRAIHCNTLLLTVTHWSIL